MNQIGDIVVFTAPGTHLGSAQPIYVFKFWDGSVQVSAQNCGTVAKRLNLGGNPAEGGSPPYVIPYRCEICNTEGTTVLVLPSTIAVNNPPTIYGAPTVTPNNEAFPFQTQVQVAAYDLENNGVHFYWYCGTHAIGGHDVKTGPISVPGTYYGTFIGSSLNCYTDTLTTTITGQGTVLTCKIVDNDGGTNLLAVPVQGYDPTAPLFSVAATPSGFTVDAATLPDAVIAPGQTVDFTAYANDPISSGSISFTWYLYGSNGWNQPGLPICSNGTITALQEGFRNDFSVSIERETNTGVRTALVTATNTTTHLTSETAIDVNLVQNVAPVMVSINIYSADGAQDLTSTVLTKQELPALTIVRFSGTAADVGNNVIYFRWDWNTPALPDVIGGTAGTYTLYGRDCFVDITSWPESQTYVTLGAVTPVDKYGVQGAPMLIPQVTLA